MSGKETLPPLRQRGEERDGQVNGVEQLVEPARDGMGHVFGMMTNVSNSSLANAAREYLFDQSRLPQVPGNRRVPVHETAESPFRLFVDSADTKAHDVVDDRSGSDRRRRVAFGHVDVVESGASPVVDSISVSRCMFLETCSLARVSSKVDSGG